MGTIGLMKGLWKLLSTHRVRIFWSLALFVGAITTWILCNGFCSKAHHSAKPLSEYMAPPSDEPLAKSTSEYNELEEEMIDLED